MLQTIGGLWHKGTYRSHGSCGGEEVDSISSSEGASQLLPKVNPVVWWKLRWNVLAKDILQQSVPSLSVSQWQAGELL